MKLNASHGSICCLFLSNCRTATAILSASASIAAQLTIFAIGAAQCAVAQLLNAREKFGKE